MASGKAVEKRPKQEVAVDPRDEPSAEWGWHGGFPRGTQIAGWVTTASMFLMLIGNHENNTENVWLIGIGLAMAAAMLYDARRRRTSWRR